MQASTGLVRALSPGSQVGLPPPPKKKESERLAYPCLKYHCSQLLYKPDTEFLYLDFLFMRDGRMNGQIVSLRNTELYHTSQLFLNIKFKNSIEHLCFRKMFGCTT